MIRFFVILIIYFSFSTFLLPWFSLGNIGGFELRSFHFLILLPFFDLKGFFTTARVYTLKFSPFFISIFSVLFINFLSIYWAKDIKGSFSEMIKNILYIYIFFCLLLLFFKISKSYSIKIGRVFIFSFVVFLFFNVILSLIMGPNVLPEAIFNAFTGNTSALQNNYIAPLTNLNPFSGAIYSRSDLNYIGPHFRNTLGVGLVISIVVLMGRKRDANSIIGYLVILLWILFLIITQSRSSLLALVFILGFYFFYRYKKQFILMFPFLLLIILVVSLIIIDNTEISALSRFYKIGDDARIPMYKKAFELIGDAPFLGYGLGTKIVSGGMEYQVHNVFLSLWYESGFLALMFGVAFVWVIIHYLIKYSRGVDDKKSIILLLPILPVIRILVGGGDSLFSFHDWVAMGLFFTEIIHLRSRYEQNT